MEKDILFTYTTISVVEETNLFYIEKEEIYKSLLDEEKTNFDEVKVRILEDLGILKLGVDNDGEVVLIQKVDRFEMQKPIEEKYESFGELYVCKDEDKKVVNKIINDLKNISVEIVEDEDFGDEVYIDLMHDIDGIDELMQHMMPLKINDKNRKDFLDMLSGLDIVFVPKILHTGQEECEKCDSETIVTVSKIIKLSNNQ